MFSPHIHMLYYFNSRKLQINDSKLIFPTEILAIIKYQQKWMRNHAIIRHYVTVFLSEMQMIKLIATRSCAAICILGGSNSDILTV